MIEALRRHWPEYLIEGVCLGLFMVSAFAFGTILEHPDSPFHRAIPNAMLRRVLMGLAMGSTAIAIIYSPWGKQSGAHINPATTLTFWRLGKIKNYDAAFYIVCQFIGGLLGALAASAVLSSWVAHPSVNHVVITPGLAGVFAAFLAEIFMTLILMTIILHVSNNPRLHKLTGLCAGRHLHHLRSADFRHEHESGSQLRLGRTGASLGRPVDLFYCAADRYVAGG